MRKPPISFRQSHKLMLIFVKIFNMSPVLEDHSPCQYLALGRLVELILGSWVCPNSRSADGGGAILLPGPYAGVSYFKVNFRSYFIQVWERISNKTLIFMQVYNYYNSYHQWNTPNTSGTSPRDVTNLLLNTGHWEVPNAKEKYL